MKRLPHVCNDIEINCGLEYIVGVKMAAGMDVREILEIEGPEQQFITKDALMNDKKVNALMLSFNERKLNMNSRNLGLTWICIA